MKLKYFVFFIAISFQNLWASKSEQALKNFEFNNLYESLYSNDEDYWGYLLDNLKNINLKKDDAYQKIKEKLFVAVKSKRISDVKNVLDEIFDTEMYRIFVPKKMQVNPFDYNFSSFAEEIWSKYAYDLGYLPSNNSLIDLAIHNRSFDILYALLEKVDAHPNREFLATLQRPGIVDPKKDESYQDLKGRCIKAIEKNDEADLESNIKSIINELKKFVPYREDNDLRKNFTGYILPRYEADLFPDLIYSAVKKKNTGIIYYLLNNPWYKNNLFDVLPGLDVDVLSLVAKLNQKALNLKLNQILAERVLHDLNDEPEKFIGLIRDIIRKTNWNKNDVLDQIIIPAFSAANNLSDSLKKPKLDAEVTAILEKIKTKHANKIQALIDDHFIHEHDGKFIDKLRQTIYFYLFMTIVGAMASKDEKINLEKECLEGLKNLNFINTYIADGLNVYIRGYAPTTILISAIEQRFPEIVQAIIDKKADVNLADAKDMTPLIYAINTSDPSFMNQIIPELLKNGANPGLKDIYGKSALDYAKNEPEIMKMLSHSKIPSPAIDNISTLSSLSSALGFLATK